MPITEKSNPLTRNLDKADTEKIVQLLGQCDAEILQEEGQAIPTHKRLYSDSVLTTMLQVAGKVQEVLKEPDEGLVVLSGGGTSGRMAFLMSVSFNQLMKGLGQKPVYTYVIAGGDRSVVASREWTEDSALHGIEELKKVAAGKKRVIVIGISVRLSAPLVAGQMDYCMDSTAVFLPVLVGFNPVSMARCLLEILRTFERAHQVTYSQSSKIATLMKQVSTSLEKKGRVHLAGRPSESSPLWMEWSASTPLVLVGPQSICSS